VSKTEQLESRVGRRLIERQWTVATAESCSGGLIAHRLTNVPGASSYYLGGIVAYSNSVKTAMLGVDPEDLARYGAVSEPVARQMAEGVRQRLAADCALAVTGVAGPSGGTPEKPVGLVFIALAAPGVDRVTRNLFEGSREDIKTQTADHALSMLLEYLA